MQALLPRIGARWALLTALAAEAVSSLRARGIQASLSAVGIATGIGAVVLLVSILSGLRRFAVEHIASAGGNVIQVSARADPQLRGAGSRPAALRAGDEQVVLASSFHFDMASAESAILTTVSWGDRLRQDTEVRGVTGSGLRILRLRPRAGRTFLPEELRHGSRVVVLGAEVSRRLFGATPALGHTVQIGAWPFVVVAVLHWAGDPERELRSGLDETVYIPYRTAEAAFRGDDRASHIRLRLRDPETEAQAAADAVAILNRARQQRGETAGQLHVANTVEQMRVYRRIVVALQVLIAVVGGLGLFVGGVGIAHGLVLSVRDRTAEVAMRRAIGATRGAVFASILMESLVLTVPAGLVGLLVSFSLTRVAILLPFVPVGARPHVSLLTSLLALSLLVVVGVTAGWSPARRAAAVAPSRASRDV